MTAPELSQGHTNEFVRKMLRGFGGILVRQQTMSDVSVDAIRVDLPAAIPHETITFGPFVYLKGDLSPWQQVFGITHACQYLAQYSGRMLEWMWFYVAEPEMRTRYIAEALRAEMELQFMCTGQLPSKERGLTMLQTSYGLGPAEIELGMMLLSRAVTAIRGGVQSTQSARIAIEVLRQSGSL